MKFTLIDLLYDMFQYSYNRMKNVFISEGEPMKTNQEIAKEVFQGKWGNNAERRRRLVEAGYDYEAIQSIVDAIAEAMPMDKILEIADEYDNQHNIIPIEITGTEALEIEVDLSKYNSIHLIFVSAKQE